MLIFDSDSENFFEVFAIGDWVVFRLYFAFFVLNSDLKILTVSSPTLKVLLFYLILPEQ